MTTYCVGVAEGRVAKRVIVGYTAAVELVAKSAAGHKANVTMDKSSQVIVLLNKLCCKKLIVVYVGSSAVMSRPNPSGRGGRVGQTVGR